MGRRASPIGVRLGLGSDWDSRWFAERNYAQVLHEDIALRRLVMRELPNAGIARIHIERAANKVDLSIFTSKPGVVIGKQGANVERLRNTIKARMKRDVHLKIEEIKTPELEARPVPENIP